MFVYSIIAAVVLVLIVVLVVKKRAQRHTNVLSPKVEAPAHSSVQPTQKKSLLSQAARLWSPLLKESSKDRRKWEEVLIQSDMGPRLTAEILTKMEKTDLSPRDFLKSELLNLLSSAELLSSPWADKKPYVVFVVGVNGVGKTTTIVKLAHRFQNQGLKVGVVGADTFRKAAIEQLERGCNRVGADFFSIMGSEESEGADPAAVVFDGLQKFRQKDLILVDTSGRLHHKKNLMEELKKMKRVAQKVISDAPHDVWMIIDSTLGQNAVAQGKAFHEAVGLTGIVLTKLDGLSRGGTVFQLFQELRTPIRFLGFGESEHDLEPFLAVNFVEELFDQSSPNP